MENNYSTDEDREMETVYGKKYSMDINLPKLVENYFGIQKNPMEVKNSNRNYKLFLIELDE